MSDPVIFLLGVLFQLPILPRFAHRGRGEAFWLWTTSSVREIGGMFILQSLTCMLDNILDRLLRYFHDVMNLIIDAPYEGSFNLADDMIILNIKVSQTPISFSLGPLNRNIFIRRTKMRIDDIMDLVKFVEATATEDQKELFESQRLRWRSMKTEVTVPIGSTMVRSPFISSIACIKSCSTDISISGTF